MKLCEYEQEILESHDALYWKQRAKVLGAALTMAMQEIADLRRERDDRDDGYEDACPSTLQLKGLAIPFSAPWVIEQ